MAKNINFFGQQQDLPRQVQQKIALAQALQREGSSSAPVQSSMEGLARVAQAISGKYQEDKAVQDQEKQVSARNEALSSALRKSEAYKEPMFNSVTGEMEGGAEKSQQVLMEELGKADPQFALQMRMQKIQQAQEQEAARQKMQMEDDRFKDRNTWGEVRDQQGNVIGQQNALTGEFKSRPDAVKTSAQMQQDLAKARAGKSTTMINNVVESQKAAAVDKMMPEIGKNLAADVNDMEPKARGATQGLRDVARTRELIGSGMFTGFGADVKLAGSKIVSALTGKEIPEIANTEEYKTITGKMALNLLSTVTLGALSKDEQVWLKDVVGGSVELDSGTLGRVMDISERAYKFDINTYNNKRGKLIQLAPAVESIYSPVEIPSFNDDDGGGGEDPIDAEIRKLEAELNGQ